MKRRRSFLVCALCSWLLVGQACDEAIAPVPDKEENRAPETFLLVEGDVQPQFYKLPLSWLGTDADGEVVGFLYRWSCEAGTSDCPFTPDWQFTEEFGIVFTLPVPGPSATYVFEVAAMDNEGEVDATPPTQVFDFFNQAPVVSFQAGTVPESSLPAITFFFEAVDPDTTAEEDDMDSRAHLDHYRVWLDGSEADAVVAPIEEGAVTLRLADFEDRFGARTIFAQVFDDGGFGSDVISHTWQVNSAPADGILLVDDCRMGGFLEQTSDNSYRNTFQKAAPDRVRILDIETLPRLRRDDLEATLDLFSDVVWYTDADTLSSGALDLAMQALDDLLNLRQGRMLLVSSLVFGSGGVFASRDEEFRGYFGVEEIYRAPDGGTNFSLSRGDTVQARVHPGLTEFNMLSLGLWPIMECFRSREDAGAAPLYFNPPGEFQRGEFVNAERFDIGVHCRLPNGAHTAYVSFPIGLPINSNTGVNETEIFELLKLIGIVDP